MGKRRQINGTKVINDLRSGMTDRELQVKYGLSANGLCTIYEKIVERGAISHLNFPDGLHSHARNALQGISKLPKSGPGHQGTHL